MLKKTVSLLIIISLFLSFSACIKTESPELAALRKDLDSNPAYTFYHSLSEEDKDIYTKICYAIENYDTEKIYPYFPTWKTFPDQLKNLQTSDYTCLKNYSFYLLLL